MTYKSAAAHAGLSAPIGQRSWAWWFTQGVGSGLFVQVIGSLSLLEIYQVVTFPFRARQFITLAFSRGVALFTVLWVGWIFGAVIADVVNGSNWSLAARGFARAFFAGFVTLCLLSSWLQRPRAFEAFLAGVPLALLIGLKYFRSGTYNAGDGTTMIDASQLGWETWGNYFAAAIAAFLIARFWRSHPWGCIVLAAVLGATNIALGSRSAGVTQLLAAAILPLFILRPHIRAVRSKIGRKRMTALRMAMTAFLGAVAIILVTIAYSELARSGALGDKAKAKHDAQSAAKGGILVGGRAEVLIGLAAVLDKPITGHGSWPEDTGCYAARASEQFGIEIRDTPVPKHSNVRKFIKAHSAIVSAWLDHGILGAIFWVYVFYLVATNLWRVTQFLPEYTGIVVFNCCGFFWAFFFSPIQSRAYTAIILVPILIIQIRRLHETRVASHPAARARLPIPLSDVLAKPA